MSFVMLFSYVTSLLTEFLFSQTDPSNIFIRTDEDKQEVVIRSTLPVLCNSSVTDDQCCLWIHLSVTGPEGNSGRLRLSIGLAVCHSDNTAIIKC